MEEEAEGEKSDGQGIRTNALPFFIVVGGSM